MAQSLSQQWIHIIFSTKDRYSFFKNIGIREKLHHYIYGICNNQKCSPIAVGGAEDHVHLLVNINKKISLSKFIEEIKRSTSHWLKTQITIEPRLSKFYWQRGYGAFSVSQSNIESVQRYIDNQVEHHKKISFQDELRQFLIKHGVEFDETYLWS